MSLNKGLIKYLTEYAMARHETNEAMLMQNALPCTKHAIRYNDKREISKRARKVLLEYIQDSDQEETTLTHLSQLRDAIDSIIKDYQET